MSKVTVFYVATAAFVIPVLVAVALNYNAIQEHFRIDPQTAPGKVLFFTSPG